MRADDHSGQDVAEHHRLLELMADDRDQSGHDHHHREILKKGVHVAIPSDAAAPATIFFLSAGAQPRIMPSIKNCARSFLRKAFGGATDLVDVERRERMLTRSIRACRSN
jgi:hypothetical protein